MSVRKGKEIYDAVERNDIDELRNLLNQKDPYLYYHNARNHRTTALHIAVANNSFECVDMLIKKGYNLEVKAHLGLRPLHFAIISTHDNYNIFTYLINMGADINAVAEDGATPIDICIRTNKFTTLYFLLSYGAKLTPNILNISAEHNNLKNTLAILMVNNYKMLQSIRCSHEDRLDLINFTNKILQQLKLDFNKVYSYFKKRVNIDSIKDVFKFIKKEIEYPKFKFINNVYNDSTYRCTYKYNKSMINALTKAISIGTESMIYSCIEATTHKKRDKKFKCKQYAAIMCIGKIGELMNQKKYYEEQLEKLYSKVNSKKNKLDAVQLYLNEEKAKINPNPLVQHF
jgi:hypothetical protein